MNEDNEIGNLEYNRMFPKKQKCLNCDFHIRVCICTQKGTNECERKSNNNYRINYSRSKKWDGSNFEFVY